MDNLRNVIDCCSIPFQQGNVFRENSQTLSDGLKDLDTQLKFLLDLWPGSLTSELRKATEEKEEQEEEQEHPS